MPEQLEKTQFLHSLRFFCTYHAFTFRLFSFASFWFLLCCFIFYDFNKRQRRDCSKSFYKCIALQHGNGHASDLVNTPPKFNMEPENDGFHVNFQGCISNLWLFNEPFPPTFVV